MKTIISIIKWTWCKYCGDRQDFAKHGDAWICTRCGREE